MQVVNQQEINPSILRAKTWEARFMERFEKIGRKLFGRKIEGLRRFGQFAGGRPDAFQKMRFAHAGGPMQKQRRDRAQPLESDPSAKMRFLIARADKKRIELGEA